MQYICEKKTFEGGVQKGIPTAEKGFPNVIICLPHAEQK